MLLEKNRLKFSLRHYLSRNWRRIQYFGCETGLAVIAKQRVTFFLELNHVGVGDELIAPKLSVRNLGVIMDNCLCMKHVKKICSEANYHLKNNLYQRFANISPRTLLKFSSMLLLVLSLTTVTHFYMVFWKYLVCGLQRVQNTAAHIVTLTRKYDSITPIMFKLHWLPEHSRIIFKPLLLVCKALNGEAPSYISTLLSHRRCSRSLHSSGQELLTVPLPKLKTYGDRLFSIAAPR